MEIKNESGIYCLEINGKLYIGQSVKVRNRIMTHKNLLKKNKHFNRYLQNYYNKYKYVKIKWVKYINYYLDKEEIYLIKKLKTIEPNGFNFQSGGNENYRHSKETRLKMSKSQKGKIVTKETRKRLSIASTGTKLSKETKRKMSKSQKGKIVTKETRLKISKAQKGKLNHNFKGEILMIDIKTEKILKKFNGSGEVDIFFDKRAAGVIMCLNGKGKTAYGYKWKRETND